MAGLVLATMFSVPIIAGYRIDARTRDLARSLDDHLRQRSRLLFGEVPRDRVTAMVQSRDGQIIAAAGSEGAILVGNSDHPERFREVGQIGGWVDALTVLGDGSVVSAGPYGELRRWDIGSFGTLEVLGEHSEGIDALCTLDDQRFISAAVDGSLRVWNIGAERDWARLGSHAIRIGALACLSGGRVVSGDTDGRVLLWDVESDGGPVEVAAHGIELRALAAIDDRYIAGLDEEGTLYQWDLEGQYSARQIGFHPEESVPQSMAVVGERIFTVGGSKLRHRGFLRVYRMDGDREGRVVGYHGDSISNFTVLRDGRIVTASRQHRTVQDSDFELFRAWDTVRLDAGGEIGRIPGEPFAKFSFIAEFMADGSLVTMRGREGIVEVRTDEDPKGHEIGRLGQRVSPRNSHLFRAGDQRAVSIDRVGRMLLWSVDSGAVEEIARTPTLREIHGAAYLPDDKVLVVKNGMMTVWDLGAKESVELAEINERTSEVWGVDENRVLINGADGVVALWTLQHDTPVVSHRWFLGADLVEYLGADRFVALDIGGRLKYWDVESEEISTLGEHRGYLGTALTVLDDGRMVGAGGPDGTLTIWDMDGMSWDLGQHGAVVIALGTRSDGRVISVGKDRVLRQWRLANADRLSANAPDRRRADRRRDVQRELDTIIDRAVESGVEIDGNVLTVLRSSEVRKKIENAGWAGRDTNRILYPIARPSSGADTLSCLYRGRPFCAMSVLDFGGEAGEPGGIKKNMNTAALTNIHRLGAFNCIEFDGFSCVGVQNSYLHRRRRVVSLVGLLVPLVATLIVLAPLRKSSALSLGLPALLAYVASAAGEALPVVLLVPITGATFALTLGAVAVWGRRRMLTEVDSAAVLFGLLGTAGLLFASTVAILARFHWAHLLVVGAAILVTLIAMAIIVDALSATLCRFYTRPLRVGR